MEYLPQLAFVVFLSLILGVAGYGWWNAPHRVAARKLKAVPAVAIRGLQPGQTVKVTGKVVLQVPLEAPISGQSCAYWQVTVREKVGKNNYHTVSEQWEGTAFTIDDGTGTVHVDPRGTKLALASTVAGRSGTFDDPSGAEALYLDRIGVSATSMLGLNRTLQFHESSLHDGEQVSVMGAVEIAVVDGEPVLTLVHDGNGELVVSDLREAHT